jgi:hypothetical protein
MQQHATAQQQSAQAWPARPGRARRLVLAALVLLAHLLALLALMRGLDLGRERESAPRPPLQVSLIRPEPVVAPQPPAVRPSRPSRPPAAVRPPVPATSAPEPTPEAPAPDAAAQVLADAGAQGAVAPEAAPDAAAPETESSADTAAAPAPEDNPEGRARAGESVAESGRQALYGVTLGAPMPGRSRFQVYYGEYTDNNAVATLDYVIEIDGERYRVATEGRAQGLTALLYSGVINQSSSGRMGPDGLMPERFVEQRGKRPERWSAVDYARAEANFSGGQKAPLQPGSQDRLSMLLQIGLILRAQPQRLAAGQTITIPELGSRTIDAAVFESLGTEVLATPSGPLQTVHLVRRDGDPARDPKVDVWLGYDHDFRPVRIRLTDVGGRVLDQLIER